MFLTTNEKGFNANYIHILVFILLLITLLLIFNHWKYLKLSLKEKLALTF